ncbi:hypothetical protein GA0074696_6152 [Micromonospora purpureochromogenes]|uniref:Uncharacterized protein n=1 Tax=Micromonospora purpureochromogenes TaxID=47872 RepID=A0A1C5AJT8_9ACTN|nr:hypothetical protein GA0074696_6152 [Micromonospora purpureochromogenes]
MSSNTPRVLVIDDEVKKEESVAAGLRASNLEVEVRPPDAVTADEMQWADVIAIDHRFDWSTISHPPECLYWPQDGLAIAAVVSGHLRKRDHHAAVVLRTGELPALADGLPVEIRKPAIAAQYGLDWVLKKEDGNVADQLHSLAEAVEGLRPLLSDPLRWNEGKGWLNLPDAKWTEGALADVQVCNPPENTVAAYTAGTAWLRWFAHRILPFPTFLLPRHWAATLLRLDVVDFDAILRGTSPLSAALGECRYTGHLAALSDGRWWRAGLDALVDDLLMEASPELTEAAALAEQMTAMHGQPVRTLSMDAPVMTIDSDYAPIDVADASSCVRLAPDFWPVFAQEPWARFDELQDDRALYRMIARGDRRRAEAGSQDV